MELSFYALKNTTVERTLPKLIEKIYNSNLRVHILCKDDEQLRLLDGTLWTFASMAFIPHGSIHDPKETHAEHPVWLSTTLDPVNQPDVFVSLLPISVPEYKKVIYFYDIFDSCSSDFNLLHDQLKEKKPTFWQQTDAGGWEKK